MAGPPARSGGLFDVRPSARDIQKLNHYAMAGPLFGAIFCDVGWLIVILLLAGSDASARHFWLANWSAPTVSNYLMWSAAFLPLSAAFWIIVYLAMGIGPTQVRVGSGHVTFLKRNGKIVYDLRVDPGQPVWFLKEFDSMSSLPSTSGDNSFRLTLPYALPSRFRRYPLSDEAVGAIKQMAKERGVSVRREQTDFLPKGGRVGWKVYFGEQHVN